MTKITLKMVLMLGVLAVLIVSVAGCTTSTTSSSTGSSQNNAVTYANAFLNDSIKPAFSGLTLTSERVLANGSDGARLSVTFYNATDNITATLSMNIQQFSSANDATAFFNNQSFGYTLGLPPNASMFANPANAAYKDTTGHEPSVRNTAYRLNSKSFWAAQADVIMQQGEFVTWGSESALLS